MRRYWRLKDIPELRDLSKIDRRKWWREAVVESRSGRDFAILLCVIFGAVFGADAIIARLGSRVGPIHLIAMAGAAALMDLIVNYGLVQPRARRWLQANLARQMTRYQKLNAD